MNGFLTSPGSDDGDISDRHRVATAKGRTVMIAEMRSTYQPGIIGNMQEEKYTDHKARGRYDCSRCGKQLFASGAKFSSGTIWPSFRKALPGAVKTKPDDSLGMHRTEILCAHCDLHLGHVFDDGRIIGDTHPEAGQRFCVLSEALDFEGESPEEAEQDTKQ